MLGGVTMEEMISNKLEYLAEKRPEKLVELAKKMHKKNPEAIESVLETVDEDGHITNRQKYDEAVQRLKWSNDKGHGERWKLEDLEKWSKIDFKNADYTKYDFAYLVNMLYAKCCKEFTDMSYFVKIAKCLLEDDDKQTKMYRGAEHDKHKHKKSNMENHYDDDDELERYEEENRRGRRRHYRNESDYDYRNEDYRNTYRGEDYRDESRRYRNEYDSRYRDNNVGFR